MSDGVGACRDCGARILFARTVRGKLMPIEPVRRPDGDITANVAAYRNGQGGTFARVLKAGEDLGGNEWRTVAHAAVCSKAVAHRDGFGELTGSHLLHGCVDFRRHFARALQECKCDI